MITRLISGIIAGVAVLTFGTTLAYAVGYFPSDDITATNTTSTYAPPAHAAAPEEYPVRLLIPSLSIDARVQYVGITSHGTMSVPSNFRDVGWYKYGPVPGTAGSAVMAGHVDNALALPGVFKKLQDIRVGADVYVVRKDGTRLHFVVDDVASYKAQEAPTDRIFNPGGATPRLALITCEGDWVQSEKQYDHRRVVYARLVGGVPSSQRSEVLNRVSPASSDQVSENNASLEIIDPTVADQSMDEDVGTSTEAGVFGSESLLEGTSTETHFVVE